MTRTQAAERTVTGSTTSIPFLPGIYQASFVDCAEHPTHGGTTRTGVLVISGDKTTVDVELGEAATGSISGHLTTEFGTPLEGVVCRGAQRPLRRASVRGSDRARWRVQVDGIGSGWYFVGFFGCNGDRPERADAGPCAPGNDLPRAVVLERVARREPRSLW